MALVCGRTRFREVGFASTIAAEFHIVGLPSICLWGRHLWCGPLLGAPLFYDLCRGEACQTSSSLLADVEAGSVEAVAGVSSCPKGEAYRVLAKDGWQGIYVSPDGDRSVPFGSGGGHPRAERLYVSLLPGAYDDLRTIVDKATRSLRIVSPAGRVRELLSMARASFPGALEEVVFRGIHFQVNGSVGLRGGDGTRLRLRDCVVGAKCVESRSCLRHARLVSILFRGFWHGNVIECPTSDSIVSGLRASASSVLWW